MVNNPFRLLMLLGLLTIVGICSGCDTGMEFSNSAPRGLTITMSECITYPRGEVMLSGAAVDDDEDPLIYRWSADAGEFDPEDGVGQSVTWTPPDSSAYVRITMTVTDEIDDRSTSSEIEVGELFPSVIMGGYTIIEDHGHTYVLTRGSPVSVGAAAYLVLEEGVRIVVNSQSGGFNVRGFLIVNGTADNEVVIGPNNCFGETDMWGGIVLTDGTARGQLQHLNAYSSNNGIQVVEGARADFDSCKVESHARSGILVTDNSNVTIFGCKIWDNDIGVRIENSNVTLTSSSIRYNGDHGVYVSTVPDTVAVFNISIERCAISANEENGIYLTNYAQVRIHNNTMFFNGPGTGLGYNIRLQAFYSDDPVQAQRNYWGYTDEDDIGVTIRDNRDPAASDVSTYVDFSDWLNDPPVEFRLHAGRREVEGIWAKSSR